MAVLGSGASGSRGGMRAVAGTTVADVMIARAGMIADAERIALAVTTAADVMIARGVMTSHALLGNALAGHRKDAVMIAVGPSAKDPTRLNTVLRIQMNQ